MFVHHLATLALLTLSWTTQMFRIGSLVIIVHDFADHWMELAKMARYAELSVSIQYATLKACASCSESSISSFRHSVI